MRPAADLLPEKEFFSQPGTCAEGIKKIVNFKKKESVWDGG